jgi:hypothetical protein
MGRLDRYKLDDTYILSTDEIASGANKLMVDLFNNTSNKKIIVNVINAAPKSDVAVTGAVSARFDFFKTSSIGTGGTSNSYRSPAPGALNISPMDSKAASLLEQGITNDGVVPGVSARINPTAGALKKHWLFAEYVFPEESAASAILQQGINLLPEIPGSDPLVLDTGEGLLIQQGSVASLNSYLFTIIFTLASKAGV